MKLRALTVALAMTLPAVAFAANTAPVAVPAAAPQAAAAPNTPKTPEEWLGRMTNFTQNATAYRDPKVFVPWFNAVTEPGFMVAGMEGAMAPSGWLNMANSMATPDALRNWMWVMDPNAYMKWMQAGMDPNFYGAMLATMTDPGKMMRWAMMPMDPKIWKVMFNTLNPNTYVNWGMAAMDPRTWNLMGNTMNPALYTGMMGTFVGPNTFGPAGNPWLSWKPAMQTGASNSWGADATASFNLFDPALLANLGSFLPTLLPGSTPSAPAAAKSAEAVKAAEPAKSVEAAKPAAAEPTKVTLSGDALFALGKSGIKDLSAEGKKSLDDVVAKIKAMGEIDQIKVVGHADPTGNAASNQKLSDARAKTVKNYLVKNGVKPGVIISSGVGSSQPVAQCDSKLPKKELAACHAPNRRVVIEIVAKAK